MKPADVKKLRTRLDWTQQDMADFLGLGHRVQIFHLEHGYTEITGSKLRLLLVLQHALDTKDSGVLEALGVEVKA